MDLQLTINLIVDSNFRLWKKRFTETQIVSAIKKQEGGMAVKEICREFGISDDKFYNWKTKYGGMEAYDITRY